MSTSVISHPVFGEGEVVDTRWGRAEVLVQFRSGLRIWVPAQRVLFAQKTEKSLDEIQARRMIEAFRLGIVPHQDVEEFTFGREAETKKAKEGLESLIRGNGDVLLVEGEYGTGKTHLLEFIHHVALKLGLATARVEFDPVEVAPNRPKRVYREMVHNLRWVANQEPGVRDSVLGVGEDAGQPTSNTQSPTLNTQHPTPDAKARRRRAEPEDVEPEPLTGNVEYGFRDLLQRAVKLKMDDHVFFSPVLSKLRNPLRLRARGKNADQIAEVFWQMIEGESTKEYAVQYRTPYRIRGGYAIPALYDFSTAGDFYCYIISGLSHICRELGLHGLVLLVDEAETVTHLWDIIAFARGMNFIEGLIRTAQNDPELRKVDYKLIHNKVRTTPYIYRTPYIYLVIATTPEPYDYTYLKMTNYARNRLMLSPLRDQALYDAFEKLVLVYQSAFPGFTLPESEKRRLAEYAFRRKSEGIRYFVKLCVEALDLTRINGRGVDYQKARSAG